MMIENFIESLYYLFSIVLLLYGYNIFYLLYGYAKYKKPRTQSLNIFPLVTVQLPVYNEKYVVKRLLNAVSSIDWPVDQLEILVLDDSTDETSQIIDSEVTHHQNNGVNLKVLRRKNRQGFKAGALNNALKITNGKYVAIFDADFIPTKEYLMETVPIMEADQKIGIVQTRWGHINRDYSKLTEAFSIGIDGYHIVEQTGRSSLGLPLNFNGSCGVLRTEAIKKSGGWASDTLSEDMDISYRIQLEGWRAVYLRDTVVPGETPPNLPAFRNQQARWAQGSLQCGRKLLGRVWASNFSLTQKIEATFHLTSYGINLLMLLSLLVTVPLLWLRSFDLVNFMKPYSFLFSICGVSTSIMYYSALKHQKLSFTQKLPYLGMLSLIGYGMSALGAMSVIKGILQKGGYFHRTPKYAVKEKTDNWRNKAYKPLNELPVLEVLLSLYSLVGMYLAASQRLWYILFFLNVYLMGYVLTAYYTYKHNSLPRERLIPVKKNPQHRVHEGEGFP